MQRKKGELKCEQHERSTINAMMESYPDTIGKELNNWLEKGDIYVHIIYTRMGLIKPTLRQNPQKKDKFVLLVNY